MISLSEVGDELEKLIHDASDLKPDEEENLGGMLLHSQGNLWEGLIKSTWD